MELSEVGWGGPHQTEDLGSSRNNLELNIVTEQPRKREDEGEQVDEEEQESSLESQPDLQAQKSHPKEDQASIEEKSSPTAFGFEKNFLRLKKPSADANTGYSERKHQDDEGNEYEEDGQDDDNSLDSGFQESRLQDLEAQMKRSSQLSRISFDKDSSSPLKKSSAPSRVSSEAEQEAEKKSSQSSRLSHVLWSKGSSDTDDEVEKETKANTETTKEAEKDKSFILENEEIEERETEGKEDESNINMERAEEKMMVKVGFNSYATLTF